MKFTKSISYTLLTVALLSVGCTKDFESLNTPPTSVTTIDPALLLARTLRDAVFSQSGESANNKFGSWIQHWAGGPVVPGSRYIASAEDNIWDQHYAYIKNLTQIRKELLGQEETSQGRTKLAIAEIFEVYVWQQFTDLFGDIPYSEVSKTVEALNRTPKFDTQEFIYKDLILRLNSAMEKLNSADASYGSADFFYAGNSQLWAKFANSLKLRLGMRMRYVNAELAKKTVIEVVQSNKGLLSSNAENAAVPTFNNAQAENYNPMLRQMVTGSSDLRYLANTLVNTLKNIQDPRLPLIVQPAVNSVGGASPNYQGIGVALTDSELAPIVRANYSTASTQTWFSATFTPIPVFALTFSEVSFFKAEAALLGWGYNANQAQGFFEEGVKAAFSIAPYNIANVPAAYLEQQVSLAGLSDEQQLARIQTQKWIHLFGRNMEAFSEWRRTQFPKLTPGTNKGSTDGQIPRRAIYSTKEEQLNTVNYAEAVKRMQNGDSFISKVWWDKK
ncbi:SusD/RagB family nutrient-binding outer membrane lipoprotein [Sphingobacteriaceae bacterium WQ 2009]|uniref:SusD/RagB family nutrient-binding outer membrane lipoprotein n=1 Tax=Rhinopithecimicrobium faecis TaxID=2820698 RepID=A0A8T4HCT2_9SPHI|nr:SusD/RagB family nutrient-binding outer membrane lipoprotein [Sphingobacteriaceae bacterium WQ 2009]